MVVGAVEPWIVVTAIATVIAAAAAIASAVVAWKAQRGARKSEKRTIALREQATEAAQRASDAAERSAEAVGEIAQAMRGPAWIGERDREIMHVRNMSGAVATGVCVAVNGAKVLNDVGPVAMGEVAGEVFVTSTEGEPALTQVVVTWEQGRAPCVVPIPPPEPYAVAMW